MTKITERESKKFSFDSSVKHLAWAIIESSPDCIFVTRNDGSLIYMNHATENLLNITFTHAFGKSIVELLSLLPLNADDVKPRNNLQRRNAPFDGTALRGYWLLARESETRLVNIEYSNLPASTGEDQNCLFSLRILDDLEKVTGANPKAKAGKTLISSVEFQSLFRNALQKCRKLGHEHSLLCIELHETAGGGSQHDNPPTLQSVLMIRNAVLQTIPLASGVCSISRNRYSILLEDCPLPSSIPRAFALASALRTAYKSMHSSSDAFSCWVGIAAVNAQSTSSCADLVGMALQACIEAKHTNKPIAIRIYRSSKSAKAQTKAVEGRDTFKP